MQTFYEIDDSLGHPYFTTADRAAALKTCRQLPGAFLAVVIDGEYDEAASSAFLNEV